MFILHGRAQLIDKNRFKLVNIHWIWNYSKFSVNLPNHGIWEWFIGSTTSEFHVRGAGLHEQFSWHEIGSACLLLHAGEIFGFIWHNILCAPETNATNIIFACLSSRRYFDWIVRCRFMGSRYFPFFFQFFFKSTLF